MSVFTTQNRSCSFCSAACADGALMAGGTGSLICADCVNRCHKAFSGKEASPDPCFGAWRGMGKAELLEQFVAILHQRRQVDAFTREWVALMKERSVSWSEIGSALGVSRQAAWERFNKPRSA